jgi:hypothetical protein
MVQLALLGGDHSRADFDDNGTCILDYQSSGLGGGRAGGIHRQLRADPKKTKKVRLSYNSGGGVYHVARDQLRN